MFRCYKTIITLRIQMRAIIQSCYFHYSNLELPPKANAIAQSKQFAIAGYKIDTAAEQLRQPRIIRIGAIQNRIILPTDAPVLDQV